MKTLKKLILCFGLLSIAALTMSLCSCDAPAKKKADIAEGCIRIHIRANSNESADQNVKLKVRDNITAYLSSRLEGCKSKQAAYETLAREQDNLIKIANYTLLEYGFSYKSSMTIGKEYFPDRTYGDYDFPKGYYDAVILRLGSGEGDNWWCVAFPPLCFMPESGGEKVIFKSWIKEYLDKLFSR